jgi:membrane protease YdiL (CAAX protease family)
MPLGWLTVTVGLLLTSLVANRLVPAEHLVIGLASVLALTAVAWAAALTPAEVGLTRWRSGLRWGGGAAGVAVLGYGVGLLVARGGLASSTARSWPDVLVAALVIVPLGTVLAEELAFRGVLWALLRRRHGERAATVLSSVLFGLWHVLPALGGGAANEAATGALGAGPVGTLARVAGTVLVTAVGGTVFCWLRVRSGSLLASTLLHWALNGLGLLAVQLAG